MVMETSRISHSEAVLSLGELPSRQHLTEDNNGNEKPKEKTSHTSQENSKFNPETAKRRCSLTSELSLSEDNSTSKRSNESKHVLTAVKANAVAFHIPAGQQVCKPPPKRFCNKQNVGRENVSLNQLVEKQKIAEARKNQLVEQRLKRIHERQEAARKLAHNVEIILQQRSIAGAPRDSNHSRPQMTSSELLATARHVARDFKTLTCQMSKDFTIEEENNNFSKQTLSCAKTHQAKKHNPGPESSNNDRSVAFTIAFDHDKQPVSPVPRKLQVVNTRQRGKLTAQDLEEKQRKAEERRNQRRQDRVKRVRENREALLKLASDLETFMIWNDTERCNPSLSVDNETPTHQFQAAQLANDIADSFDRLSQRYTRDLKQAEGFSFCW